MRLGRTPLFVSLLLLAGAVRALAANTCAESNCIETTHCDVGGCNYCSKFTNTNSDGGVRYEPFVCGNGSVVFTIGFPYDYGNVEVYSADGAFYYLGLTRGAGTHSTGPVGFEPGTVILRQYDDVALGRRNEHVSIVCLKGNQCCGAPCNDDNGCTKDVCNPMSGCSYPANFSACNDANLCTTNDRCRDDKQCRGDRISCGQCSACDPATGACRGTSGDPCNDGDLCSVGDKCSNGLCVAGGPKNCSDTDPCTDGYCVAGACHQRYNTAPCNDGSVCTGNDRCSNGTCRGDAAAANGTVCNDFLLCNGIERCSGGVCQTAAPACPIVNPCTTATCDEARKVCTYRRVAGCAIDVLPGVLATLLDP